MSLHDLCSQHFEKNAGLFSKIETGLGNAAKGFSAGARVPLGSLGRSAANLVDDFGNVVPKPGSAPGTGWRGLGGWGGMNNAQRLGAVGGLTATPAAAAYGIHDAYKGVTNYVDNQKQQLIDKSMQAAQNNWKNMGWMNRIGMLFKLLFSGNLDKEFMKRMMTPDAWKSSSVMKLACVAADLHNLRPDIRFSPEIEALAAARGGVKSASTSMRALVEDIPAEVIKQAFCKMALTWESNLRIGNNVFPDLDTVPTHTTVNIGEDEGASPLAKSAGHYKALAVAAGLADKSCVDRW